MADDDQKATQAGSNDDSNAAGTRPEEEPSNADEQKRKAEQDALAKRVREANDRKWQKKLDAELQAATAAAIEDFKADLGLDEESIEKIRNADKDAAEKRELKRKATRAQNELEKIQTRADTMHSMLQKSLVTDRILRAGAGKVVDGAEVDLLNRAVPRTRLEEDFTVSVLDAEGEISHLSFDELVDEILDKNPHLQRPSGSPGAGSRASESGAGSDKDKPDLTTREGRRKALQGFPQ